MGGPTDPARYLECVINCLAQRNRCGIEALAQGFAVQEFRYQVGRSVFVAYIVDYQNVWMIEG